MKKNRKDLMEVKRKIVTVIIVLIIILMIFGLVVLYMNPKKEHEYEILGVYKPENYVEEESDNINFTNMELLSEFNGKLPVSTGIKSLNEIFINQIPKYIENTKDYNDGELKKYYNDNKDEITKNLRIDSEESFINMNTKYKTLQVENYAKIEECEILKGDNINLIIKYSNGETITCDMLGKEIYSFRLIF